MTEVHRVVDHTGRPKYVEVAESLRKAIASGQYPIGSELPSTARLTETYGVSTTVVRAAVRIRGRWLVPKRVIDALIANAEAALPQHEQEV